jgi:hypothetical protein
MKPRPAPSGISTASWSCCILYNPKLCFRSQLLQSHDCITSALDALPSRTSLEMPFVNGVYMGQSSPLLLWEAPLLYQPCWRYSFAVVRRSLLLPPQPPIKERLYRAAGEDFKKMPRFIVGVYADSHSCCACRGRFTCDLAPHHQGVVVGRSVAICCLEPRPAPSGITCLLNLTNCGSLAGGSLLLC